MSSTNFIIPLVIQLLSYSPQTILLPLQISSSIYKTYKWFYPKKTEPVIYVIENVNNSNEFDENDNNFTLISKVSF